MAGAFNDDLYARIPGPICQFAQMNQLLHLVTVCGINQATGPYAVSQAQSDFILFEDIQQVIKILKHGIFFVVMSHPLNGKGTPAADYPHEARLAVHPFQCIFGDAAVYGHKINAVFSLLNNGLEHMVNLNIDDGLFLLLHCFGNRLINRYSTQWYRALFNDAASYGIEITTHAQVHDGISAGLNRNTEFLQFVSHFRQVLGRTNICIDLG